MKPQPIELDPDDLTRLRRGVTAKFCASLTPADWLALETLEPRLKNAVLTLAVRELLKRRTKGRARD